MFAKEELLAITEILLDVIHDETALTIEYGQVSKRLASKYHIYISPDEIDKGLDQINRVAHHLGLPHISVIVTSKGEKLPGGGFYKLMRKLNPMYTKEIDDLEIWSIESNAVYKWKEWTPLLDEFRVNKSEVVPPERIIKVSQGNQLVEKQSSIYEYTKELIHHRGLILDQSNKTFTRFTTERLDSIANRVGEGWTESKRVLLFEIENRKSRYTLKLIIGPASPEIRQLVHNITKDNIDVYNKGNTSLTGRWTTVYSNKFLGKDDISNMSIDEIKQTIQKRFDKFLNKDLDRLCGILEDNMATKILNTTEWIITCNSKFYDVKGAFGKLEHIEWKQSVNVKQGDIVYIYLTSPEKQIKYKCIATQVDLPIDKIDDREFMLDTSPYENYGRYMDLKLLDEYEDGMLTLEFLKENGVKSVQGPSRVSTQLSRAIKEMIEKYYGIKEIEDNIIASEQIKDTEKQVLIKVRIGHGRLKKRLLEKETRCKICGLSDERFLIASHIKPWSESNNQERLDLDNVLLLCPHHDTAFDKGYITFNKEGKLRISSELTSEARALLNLIEGDQIQLNDGGKKYINWHRENIFRA